MGELDRYTYNSKYLIKNDKPYFPVMGEMHYSRTNPDEWRDSLLKMKSGGVDIVSSYVIWIHHEENEGKYNFEGPCDIRRFIKTIDELGLKMWLRIGPFVHAEVRNGGFPDWLMNKDINLRSNDKEYLYESEKFLRRIYEEVKGLFHKDGGPIIGIQIENEFGHVGQTDNADGKSHMSVLMDMLKEIGMDVPYYTATGWGGASIGECIPVMGGYCEAPWERKSKKLPPSNNYVITKERDDHKIGLNIPIGSAEKYSYDEYPFLTAELGGGLAVTYRRRPIAKPKDISAVAFVKIASGCNLLGFYMYHGGINPKGINTPLNETISTGSWCDLPEFDYDFQAPIGSYGIVSDTYKELKLLTMFVKDFGEKLCDMKAHIDTRKIGGILYESEIGKSDDLTSFRKSVRKDNESGFLFLSNYVRDYEMAEHNDLSIMVNTKEAGEFVFNDITLKDGDFFAYPFNLKVGNLRIITATAMPLCTLSNSANEIDSVVLYGQKDAKINEEIINKEDKLKTKSIIISRKEALNSYKINLDREYLFMSKNILVLDDENGILNINGNEDIIKVYPSHKKLEFEDFKYIGEEDGFSVYSRNNAFRNAFADIVKSKTTSEKEYIGNSGFTDSKDVKTIELNIDINYNFTMVKESDVDIVMNVDYQGDMARLYIDKELENDQFYIGNPWKIGLKEYGYPNEIKLEIIGMPKDNDIYVEKPLDYVDNVACSVNKIDFDVRLKDRLKINK